MQGNCWGWFWCPGLLSLGVPVQVLSFLMPVDSFFFFLSICISKYYLSLQIAIIGLYCQIFLAEYFGVIHIVHLDIGLESNI